MAVNLHSPAFPRMRLPETLRAAKLVVKILRLVPGTEGGPRPSPDIRPSERNQDRCNLGVVQNACYGAGLRRDALDVGKPHTQPTQDTPE